MTADNEHLIRQRAFELWEGEGSPHGRAAEHWEQARHEIEDAVKQQGARSGAVEPATEAPAAPKRAGSRKSAGTPAEATEAPKKPRKRAVT